METWDTPAANQAGGDVPPGSEEIGLAAGRAARSRARSGLALCLSGGGYRAALFHLGATRRLNELGILSRVDTFSCVSGGSIFGAFLAARIRSWPEPGQEIVDWERSVAGPFRNVVRHNIRTIPVATRYLLPWNVIREGVETEALQAAYSRLISDMRLGQLPERPRFVFCATDMQYGVNWTFGSRARVEGANRVTPKDRIGDYRAGYTRDPELPLARAVAASSCFPPVFAPMVAGYAPGRLKGGTAEQEAKRELDPARRSELLARRERLVGGLRLTDGGVYDNMGLEPVWTSHATILVSDGGAPFNFEEDRRLLLFRAIRYYAIAGSQASAVRRRLLVQTLETEPDVKGAYWGIQSARERYNQPGGYSKSVAAEWIAKIRTDMDAFTDAEISVLETHGYDVADAAIERWVPDLKRAGALPYAPTNGRRSDAAVQRALKQSADFKLLGRWRTSPLRLPRWPRA